MATALKSKKQPKSDYHHGDLRRALLDAAIEHVAASDVATLSCRELARTLGVTPGAPYHHFRDRGELLGVVAAEGFSRLLDLMTEIAQVEPDARNVVARLGPAYVEFGRRHPGYYRTMFLSDAERPEGGGPKKEAAEACFATLGRAIARALPRTADAVVREKAIALWAFVHGLVVLSDPGPLRRKLSKPQEREFITRGSFAILDSSWSQT